MLHIAPIAFNSPLYHEAVALRVLVLRQPLGMQLRPEDVAQDAQRLHWGAIEGNELVGSVSFAVQENMGRVKQMVVSPRVQQQGVGKQLMAALEDHAKAQGIAGIMMHARETAQAFYARLGYQPVGALFEEVGLPHVRMEKALA